MIFERSQNDTNISHSLECKESNRESIRCSSPILDSLETRKSLISQRNRRSETNNSFEEDLSDRLRQRKS